MARELAEQREAETASSTDDVTVFEAGQDTPTEEPFEYAEEELNLVTAFKQHPEGKDALKRIGNKVFEDFDQGWRANEKFRANMANIWSLFSGNLDPKDPLFKDLSNAHVPILMENTVRMVFRQAHELFGNWTNVFGVSPVGPDDEKVAKLLTLHGNWQIRKRIKDFKREIGHRGLLIFDLFGDVTCHSYWDPVRRANRHQILTANEFVCANAHVSTMPDYSDVTWLAKLIKMDAHELRKKDGEWEDVVTTLKALPPAWGSETAQELRDAVDKSLGTDRTEYEKGQYEIIHYEGWLNLPGQDRDRYCLVLLDKQTKTVLKLAIHERVDSFEKRRFEFETQQKQSWMQATQLRQQVIQDQQATAQTAIEAAMTAPPDGEGPTQLIMQARQIAEQPPPPEPPMPDWMRGDPNAEPRPAEAKPICMFSHGVNIEPIAGVLGLGTGTIHAAQNRAANIALSMFIDQGTLGNFKNFLAKGELQFEESGGTLKIAPGKIHKVRGAMDLSKDMVPLDFGEANAQLLQLVEMLVRFGNTVSNTPEVLSGEAGKSGETAQGLSARIEQATKMLSVPTGKYADFVTQVLENNALLNAIFMEEVEFFSVNNHDPALGALGRQNFKVGREMYDRVYEVEISADLKFTSTQQRISEADALVQMPQAVEELAGNFAFKHAVVSKSLEARNRYDLIALIGPPPQPPPVYGAPTSPPAPPPGAPMPGGPPAPGAAPPGGPPGPPGKGPGAGPQRPGGAPTAMGQQQRGTPKAGP